MAISTPRIACPMTAIVVAVKRHPPVAVIKAIAAPVVGGAVIVPVSKVVAVPHTAAIRAVVTAPDRPAPIGIASVVDIGRCGRARCRRQGTGAQQRRERGGCKQFAGHVVFSLLGAKFHAHRHEGKTVVATARSRIGAN